MDVSSIFEDKNLRALVTRDRWAVRRMRVGGGAMFVVGLAAVAFVVAGSEIVAEYALLVLALMASQSTWGEWRRAKAYRAGWVEGRAALLESMDQAAP